MRFEDEFEELAALAYQMAFQVLGSRADAEEVAQDTMTKAFVRWRRVRRHARPWVCRVAINGALGRVRRRARRLPDSAMSPHADVADVAVRLDLQRLLRSLSGRQRDVVVLRYLADMSESDVAAELGISVGSVKRHAHRGIASLRSSLEISTDHHDAESGAPRPEPTETTDV
ncbi:MAG: sigma-70 family RNA polymerase sigma factor [Actinomycetota bacterium]